MDPWDALCPNQDVHSCIALGTPILSRSQLLDVYKFLHIYCPKRQLFTLDSTNYQYHKHIKPDHFPSLVTFMVDTFPVKVSQPEDSILAKALFNPKYHSCVYKFQYATTFMGISPLFTGPHIGVGYDGNTFLDTEEQHPMQPWELGLADGAYVACPQLLCPHRKPPRGQLTEDQLLTNAVISHYRARVEHKNKLIERHNILGRVFRGGLELLADAAHVLAHTENVDAKMHIRYPPVGPWGHAPDEGEEE